MTCNSSGDVLNLKGGKSTQCAAVKTYWSEIKVPPQSGLLDLRSFLGLLGPLSTSPTCQGMEPTSAVQSSPLGQIMPTNLERGFLVRPQLHPETEATFRKLPTKLFFNELFTVIFWFL